MPWSISPRRRRVVDTDNLLAITGVAAAAVTVVQGVTATLALRRGRRDYADAAWGPGLAAVAITAAVVGEGNAVRRWSLAAATTAWAARLENQMVGRMRSSDEEDPRYTEFLEGDSNAKVLLKVFVTQGVSQLLVSAPLQLAGASRLGDGRRRALLGIGLAATAAGAITEAMADKQKQEYSELEDDEKPDILDTGLWGWSRHPNYFGDSLVWDGIWLASASSGPAYATLPAPIAMSYFLMFATGAKRTEKRMEDRDGYKDYQRRVSFFFPWPPKD